LKNHKFLTFQNKTLKIMKPRNMQLILLIGGALTLSGALITSCKKSSSGGGGGGTKVVVPTNPGGYDSSAQIQPSSLLSYFPFNGSFNDTKGSLVAQIPSNTGYSAPTFGTGMTSGTQAYQGSGNSYLLVPLGSEASMFAGTGFQSFTVSLWINEPQEPIYAPSGYYTAGQGPEGVFFMYDAGSPAHQDLLHMDIEPFAPTTQDTMSLNAGFVATGLTTTGAYAGSTPGGTEGVVPNGRLDTAIKKWTHVVMTYQASSSDYTLYENGTAVFANSAWSTYAAGPAPVQILTGPTGGTGSEGLGPLNYTPTPAGFVIGAWCGNAGVGGADTSQYTGSFKGALQHLRIYNTALDASDVKSLYILEQVGL
jgi:hypothetical protein